MSLEAYVWASNLPQNACSSTAFRVLLKYADRADRFGCTSWRSEADLAEELGCSTRTIRRARAELVELGLMSLGDQSYVEHIRADRRPTVYDVETPAKRLRDHLNHGGTDLSARSIHGGTDSGRTGGQLLSYRTVHEPTYQDSQHHLSLVTARESAMKP